MQVLVLAAHPDDETLGCGATISKFSSQGDDVYLLTFTDGIGARSKGNRTSSLEEVSKILGIKKYKSLQFPDNEMDSVSLLSVVKEIEKFIEEEGLNPDIVFTHSPDCLNIDHRAVYEATITAFRGMDKFNPVKIACYEVPSSSEWNPVKKNFFANMFVDASEHYSKKLTALVVYQNERRNPPHPRSYENVMNVLKVNGASVGLRYAERFMIIREVIC